MALRDVQTYLFSLCAILQGMGFALIPAMGAIFTNGRFHDLSPSQFGSLFVPMIFGAILSLFTGMNVVLRNGVKSMLMTALFVNGVAFALIAVTNNLIADNLIDYAALLMACLAVGVAIGAILITLNSYSSKLISTNALFTVTILLSAGSTLAPLLLNLALWLGNWWYAPAILAVGFFGLLVIVAGLMLDIPSPPLSRVHPSQIPHLFWLLIIFTVLYTFCETFIGSWATIYLVSLKDFNLRQANYALSLFWGGITTGRIITYFSSLWMTPRRLFALLPLFVVLVLLWIPNAHTLSANMTAYALAGLACSGCLPLTLNIAKNKFDSSASRIALAYMFGYAAAAYGTGALFEWFAVPFSALFYLAATISVSAWATALIWQKRG